jgi:dTDP-glucose 4,6-dehydratase
MATCLVTGGAGFLGSHLCDELLERGHRVICVDNFETGSLANIQHIRRPEFRHEHRNIIEPFFIDDEPVDVVYHFASPASPIDYLQMPIETLKVGSIGTLHALGMAKEKRARFVLASTSEVYGDPQVHPQPESYWGHVNPVGPRGVYDEAKRFAEAITMAYRRTVGENTSIVRIFNTFGPRMRPDDGRAIPTFIRQALLGDPLTVTGDGRQTRSICFVDDLIEGIVRVLHSDLPGPFNIGNPQEYSVLSIAEMIRELAGSDSPIEYVPRPEDDPTVRQPDIGLAMAELGWEPKVDVRDGLAITIDWFREAMARDRSGTPG